MYDFASTESEAVGEPLARPPLMLTALEPVRLPVELSSSVALDLITRMLPLTPLAPLTGARASRRPGRGRPVLVLPGFYAGDRLTRRLRGHLRGLGFHVYGWGLGRNHGLTTAIVDGTLARLEDIHARHGAPVSVVGWSFGGLLARWLAHERPDLVRQVVCLGSPWRAEGEVTRSTALFERAAREHGLHADAREIVARLRRPVPVPCTAIYSKTDGVVNWRACALDETVDQHNVAVLSSHVGLVSNPLALAAVAGRLR